MSTSLRIIWVAIQCQMPYLTENDLNWQLNKCLTPSLIIAQGVSYWVKMYFFKKLITTRASLVDYATSFTHLETYSTAIKIYWYEKKEKWFHEVNFSNSFTSSILFKCISFFLACKLTSIMPLHENISISEHWKSVEFKLLSFYSCLWSIEVSSICRWMTLLKYLMDLFFRNTPLNILI